MAEVGESLDFWALLDEVADDTVNRLVYEMGPTTVSCAFGDGDTVDILSICDPSSLSDSVAGVVVADDKCKHVQLNMEEVSTEKRCDKLVLPAAGPLSTEQSPHLSLQLKPSANSRFIIGTGNSFHFPGSWFFLLVVFFVPKSSLRKHCFGFCQVV